MDKYREVLLKRIRRIERKSAAYFALAKTYYKATEDGRRLPGTERQRMERIIELHQDLYQDLWWEARSALGLYDRIRKMEQDEV